MFDELINGKKRMAFVGANSQGKTYALEQIIKNKNVKDHCIAVWSEVKSDENMKNSADNSTLMTWINRLIDIQSIKDTLDEIIKDLDFSEINNNSFLNISLSNAVESFKNLIGVNVTTSSNIFGNPGSGEKFWAQLKVISKILSENTDNVYQYLIIDEPERHLHPSLFKLVGTVLKEISNKNINVIIATHSPVILKYFIEDTDEIFVFKNGEAKQIPSKKSFVNLIDAYNLYNEDKFKYESYSLIESKKEEYFELFFLPIILRCVFSKCVLLGEGHVEKEIFELLNERYSNEEILTNVQTEIVFGKCFFPWLISCFHECGLKVVALFDTDIKEDDDKTTNKYIKHNNCNNIIERTADGVVSLAPKIENILKIPDEKRSDKVKINLIEIRKRYMDNDLTVINLLSNIYEAIKSIAKSSL